MWDPFEYLMARKRDGLIKTEFPVSLGKISYQIPCHGRVQNIGKKTEEMLKMVPGTYVQTNERCSGHAGTFGVKKATHQQAMKIGKPLFKADGRARNRFGAAADCAIAGRHMPTRLGRIHRADNSIRLHLAGASPMVEVNCLNHRVRRDARANPK